jgi:ABC transporter substrate binding protein
VQLNPDVIVATASANALAAKTATSTIPIVVPALGNPIALGLIESDARPGGNLTGIGCRLCRKRRGRADGGDQGDSSANQFGR